MEVLRVFNNNVVLARDDDGRQVVLTGRGLGFQARPGQPVRTERVVQTFVPAQGRDPDTFGQLLASIPPEHVALAADALATVEAELAVPVSSSTVVALADHLSFAIKRARQGLLLDYPLRAEIVHLYPREVTLAERLLAVVNRRLELPLPDEEAVPVALHLVNAGFNTGDLSQTYRMTGVMGQVFDLVEAVFGPVDRDGVSAARFITHLRYFFVRAADGRQLADDLDPVAEALRLSMPDAFRCARLVGEVLELRLGHPVTTSEVVYLAMHVGRLATERPSPGTDAPETDAPEADVPETDAQEHSHDDPA